MVKEVNPHNTETLSNFIQYSGKKNPIRSRYNRPKLLDRMDKLEKTINASTTPKTKYTNYSDRKKNFLCITCSS
ncbi:hypothetical protein EDC94DRAFT_606306 [Helicostylum pulchrum]|nr:hypothetical protein EDC94DRAFT_606306 [Helicostylum pulchrum]